jgi:hypothetical protein
MRFDDGAVHAGRKSEVVRVDDEPPQAVSLAAAARISSPAAQPMWEILVDYVRRHRTGKRVGDAATSSTFQSKPARGLSTSLVTDDGLFEALKTYLAKIPSVSVISAGFSDDGCLPTAC